MLLSIITPAFNESSNLDALYGRLRAAAEAAGVEWEWVVVDDHSADATFTVIEQLAARDARVAGLRLSRNSGSHVAIMCGLHHATGDAAVVMAADLQDPPETLAVLLARWRAGAQVVWATRRERPGEKAHTGFAALYYRMMRRMEGMDGMPVRGADFFLVDRVVMDAFARYADRHISVLALLTSLGFRQDHVEYDKQPRVSGQSGWTVKKKIALVADSVTAFSAFPIRVCAWVGLGLFALAAVVAVLSPFALPSLGTGVLVILAVMFGLTGLQLLAIGIVGEYVWRALEQARNRPQYLVEAFVGRIRQAAIQ